MSTEQHTRQTLDEVESAAIDELTRRVEDIDNSYRAVAEKVGQLYLSADEYRLDELTAQLDKPMRNASENEQTFAALLDVLKMQQNRRRAAR